MSGGRGRGRLAAAVLALLLAPGARVPAQAPPPPPAPAAVAGPGAGLSLDAVETQYAAAVRAAEAARVAALDRLAQSQAGAEADATRVLMFQRILEAELYKEGEPIAERVLAGAKLAPSVRSLANAVNIYAEAARGEFETSLASLQRALAAGAGANAADADALPVAERLSLFQHYVHYCELNGRYDIAAKAVDAAAAVVKEPALADYLASWKARLALVGQPAPALAGTDLDGKPFNLADLKGQAVLIVFWASWCLPGADQIDDFVAFSEALKPRGLRVVGVNLDAAAEDAPPMETLLPNIKRFILDYNVPWPTLLSATGAKDLAKPFGVTELPSNVLVGRDGKVVALDLDAGHFQQVVGAALGEK
jgi:thiol-disulfide isomerase/thioredoxin